jgi:hypothetical protein
MVEQQSVEELLQEAEAISECSKLVTSVSKRVESDRDPGSHCGVKHPGVLCGVERSLRAVGLAGSEM